MHPVNLSGGSVIRSLPLSSLLTQLQPQIITLRCRGYIFFGSTLQIMEDVMSSVVLAPGLEHAKTSSSRNPSPALTPGHGNEPPLPPTRFVLFDFTMVTGLDATAARSCFLNLCRTLTPLGINLVFGGVEAGGRVEQLLIGHNILGVPLGSPTALRFDTIDQALEYCEDDLLCTSTPSLAKPTSASASGASAGATGAHSSTGGATGLIDVLSPLVEASWSDMLHGLAPFFTECNFALGELIFRKGELAHSIYFITSGEVTLWERDAADHSSAGSSSALPHLAQATGDAGGRAGAGPSKPIKGRRLVRYVNGGIFGELDFFLRNPRSFDAVASSADCTVQMLTREALQSMQSTASQLAAALEHALLKYLSFQVNAKLGLSDGIMDACHSLA